jgi:selenide, water dikinase
VRHLHTGTSEDLLVGTETGDDAAVWRIADDRAMVVTADFITPVVDDAFTWGKIAAANSVSDVYAMGGKPMLALNLVGWNTDELPTELLGEVMAGGAAIAAEAGFVIAGGHTVDDPEPKYGLSVVGEVHPDRMLTNAGLKEDQILILTKPLGIGVATTAIKRGIASDALAAAAVGNMTKLNNHAADIAVSSGATGATDVTGFGLLGHLGRMAEESGVSVELDVDTIPILDEVRGLAEDGVVPGGSMRNLDYVTPRLQIKGPDELAVLLLADAQTSGGLIFGVDAKYTDEVLRRLKETDHTAAVVGRVISGSGQIILL